MTADTSLHRCRSCGELTRLLPELRSLVEVPGTCTCGAETTFLKVGYHLPIWTVYDSPRDLPGQFVARLFILDRATAKVIKAPTLEALRKLLPPGLTCLPRNPQDDPVIVETWL